MATFTGSPVVPAGLSPEELLAPMAAFDTHTNALYKQQSDQQQIGATDMAMVGRAAGSLLGMSETDAAAAYPGMIADLQRQGFAKNAPPTYPGHAAVQGLVQRGLTVPEQYNTGLLTAPGVTEALKGASAPLNFNRMPSGGGGGGGTGTGAAATPGGGGSFLSALAQTESGDKNIVSGVDTDSQGRTLAQGGNASEISQGHFQIQTATWRDFAKQAGVDINQYPNAMSAPREIQAQVASVIPFSRFGPRTQQLMRQRFGDFDSNRTVGDLAGLGPRVTPAAGAGVAPTQQAAPAASPPPLNPNAGPRIANLPQPAPPPPPVAPSPIALRTGGTDVAGPGAGQTTLPPVEAPNQLYQTGLPGVTINGPGNTLAPPGTAVAGNTAAPPIQPQPQPAPPQPAARPPATGVNSPQFQAAMELNRRAQMLDMVVDPTGRTKALAASLRAQAALYMQADSYQSATQDGLTGQRSQLTNKFEPYGARRLQKLDDGRIINDQGQTIGYATPYKVEQDPNTHQPMYVPQYPTPPNLSAVPGAPSAGGMTGAVPVPGTTPDLGFAKEQEAEAGRLSKLRESIIEQARESGSANTMIQNTETAMAEAQKGNIGPNAVAPDLLNVVATAKALGMNLKSFGIDDTKLAAAQVTREQLQQLNGAILRKMYPQRITNADLAVSGAALPNYGLDPAALTANFGIYKRQNAYDTAKAQDMLSYEREHGTLRGWEHEWYNKNNFAPGPLEGLFGDAKSGALAGGGGSGGSGGGSGTTQPASGAPPATMLKDGVVTTFKNGQQWTLRNGQPAQVK